ncbi:MAG: hypothetical protein FWG49_05360 [Leptospirales bacterium]|nr:hypothetical protein [Leptospirales bacterium]
MLKIGESLTFTDDPAIFTDVFTGADFNFGNYSKKRVLLSFVEFNNGWVWLKHLLNIGTSLSMDDDLQIVAVIFQTSGKLTDKKIREKIYQDTDLKNIEAQNLSNFVIAKDISDSSLISNKYAVIYSNYIINDSSFCLKSPGYSCYSYIAFNDTICDKWHTNCSGFDAIGDTDEGSAVILVPDNKIFSTGDSISGDGLPSITTVKSVYSDNRIILDKEVNKTFKGQKLEIGSNDPISFKRIDIEGEPPFNSRDFYSSEKYIIERLGNLTNRPVILGAEPVLGAVLNSLKSADIFFSKPVKNIQDKSKYAISGNGVGSLRIGDIICGGINIVENSVTLLFDGLGKNGEVIISIHEDIIDLAGNSFLYNSVRYTLDLIPPAITSFVNDSGSPTSLSAIKFTLKGYDDFKITYWQVNESSLAPEPDDPMWEEYVPRSSEFSISSIYNISQGDGIKYIYAWLKDEAGNISSTSENSQFTLMYDTRIPLVTSFVPHKNEPTNESRVYFTLTGLDGLKNLEWLITESMEKPLAEDHRWLDYIPAYYDLSVNKSGNVTLYAWVKDGSGNISSICKDSHFDIIYNIDPPLITDFKISTESPTSSSEILIKSLEAADNIGVEEWLITQSDEKPDIDDYRWSKSKPDVYNISTNVSSDITLFVWAKDAAGNISGINDNSFVNLVYDIDPPEITEFYSKETEIINKKEVIIASLKGRDNVGITGWKITQSNRKPDIFDEGWLKSKPRKFKFSADSDSSVTLYAWGRDAAGNVSNVSKTSRFSIKYIAPKAKIKIECVSNGSILSNGDIVNFDDTALGKSSFLIFNIENTGDAALIVSKVSLSNGKGFAINPPVEGKVVIESKNSITFGVQFNPEKIRQYNTLLIIKSNNPDGDFFTVELNGYGAPSIYLSGSITGKLENSRIPIYNNSVFDIGTSACGKKTSIVLYIANNGASDIVLSSISKKNSSAAFKISPLPRLPMAIAPNGIISAGIELLPRSYNREYSQTVRIVSSDVLCPDFIFTIKSKSSSRDTVKKTGAKKMSKK